LIKGRTFFKTILILLAMCAVFVVLLNILVQNSSVQQYLLGQLGKTYGYEFKSGSINVGFRSGIGLRIKDLEARSLEGSERFEAPEIDVALSFSALLRGTISVSRVFISQPRIHLALERRPKTLDDVNEFSFAKMITAGLAGLQSASVRQANVSVTNGLFGIQGLDFEVYPVGKDPVRLMAGMRGKVVSRKEVAPFSLQGTIASDEKTVSGLSAEMKLKSGRFPLNWIPCPKSLTFNKGSGELDMNIRATNGGSFSAEGKIFAADVHFSVVRHGREKVYSFDRLEADVVSSYSDKNLEISSLKLKGPDCSVSANSRFDFNDVTNPHFFFRVNTPLMPFTTLKEIFPTCLIPPWIENEILSIVSEGKARLDHFTMNGTRDQYKHLAAPENAEVMSMQVEWADIEVFKEGGALPFKRVTGSYRLKEKRHLVTITQAVFGNSTIEHASLAIDKRFGEYEYRIVMDGLFELEDLMRQENLYLMPGGVINKLKAFQSVSGKLEAHFQVGFKRGWTHPRIFKGRFLARKCWIDHSRRYLPLFLDQAALVIKEEGENRFQGNGRWGRSEIQFSGLTDSQWDNAEVQLKSLMQPTEILNQFYKGQHLFLTSKDPVPLQAVFSRKNKVWSSQGTVDLNNLCLDTDAFHLDPPGKADKAVFDVELIPEKEFTLKHVKCDLGQSVIEMSGSWDLKHKGVMNLEVLTDSLSLTDLGGRFKEQVIRANGVIELDLSVKRFFRDGLEISVTGKATGKNISCDLKQIPSNVQECGFKVDFSEKDVTIHSLELSAGRTPVRIQGRLKGWDGLKGRLDINIDHLDASDFIDDDIFASDKKSLPGPFMGKTDIALRLTARKGLWKRLSYGPLQAECNLRSGDLYIKHAEATMEYGTVILKGHVKRRDGPDRLSFSSQIQLEEQPVNDFLYSLGVEKKALEGTLDMTIAMSSKGNGKMGLISGLQGNGHFLLEKGRIHSPYGVFYKILDVMNIQNILKMRMPDLSKKAFPFEYIEAHAGCKDGIIETDDLTMASPILNAVSTGNMDFNKRHIDCIIWVQTLETMDFVISKVPIIGYLLTEKEHAPKGVLIYPIAVKGKWPDPEIKYAPSPLRFGSGVFNIFKRILTVPGYYFEKISGKKENKEEESAPFPVFGTEFEKTVPIR